MKTRTIVWTLALCFVAAAVGFASNPNMGTWKLNEAKSKFPPMAPKNNTVVYEAAGDNVKVTVDGTDGEGKPTHNEWTGKFDGKDYPYKGDPGTTSVSLKKINANTLEETDKRDGKITSVSRATVSSDGKTMKIDVDDKLHGTTASYVAMKQ